MKADEHDWMATERDERRRQGLYRERRRLQSGQGARVRWQGREFVNFASNDYLNLSTDRRLARAAARAAKRYGTGAGASPLVSGYLPPLRALERDLARWLGTESALVFSSGYAANLAVLAALAGPEDVIFSDELNHASLIDGCRLARAQVCVFRHADTDHLRELLNGQGPKARRRFIVSDTVFSMDGDVAPLVELAGLAERHDAMLVIDEAHATGVLGEHGRGVSEALPVAFDPRRLVKVGTLSKALASQGGFVCGTRLLTDWLVNNARPYIFSTALAPTSAAAARRALAIVVAEPQTRRRLHELADFLRDRLRDIGYPGTGSRSQIVPLIVGDAKAAVELSKRLEADGLLVPAIRPPSVPDGGARLRVSLTAGHTQEDVQRLVQALHLAAPLAGHGPRPASEARAAPRQRGG